MEGLFDPKTILLIAKMLDSIRELDQQLEQLEFSPAERAGAINGAVGKLLVERAMG